MATERLDIVVTEKGAKSAADGIDRIGKEAKDTSGALGLMQKALAGLGIAAAVHQAIALADAYTNIQNRLRNVTTSTSQLTAVTESLFGIANKTRQSFETTAELYARVGLAAKDLGVSQKELLSFTESLNQAVALSGASAAEASSAMLQLSQGLAAGALRGEELNAVLEATPVIADVIAKELKITRGELRAMGQEGKITAEIVLDAFANAREELAERFGKTVPTIGQSFTVLRNNVVGLWGEFTTGSGISETLSKAVLGLANNLDVLVKGLLAVATTAAVAFAPAAISAGITAATRAMLLFNAAVVANPLGALVLTLTAATSALFFFRDEVVLSKEEGRELGDVFEAAGDKIMESFTDVNGQVSAFGQVLQNLASQFTWEKFGEGMDNVIKLFDVIVAGIMAIDRATVELNKVIVDALVLGFQKAYNLVVPVLNKIVEGINVVYEALNQMGASYDLVKPFEEYATTTVAELGTRVADAFSEGFDEGIANSLTMRSRAIAEREAEIERYKAKLTPGTAGTGDSGRTPTTPKTDDKAAKKLADQLKREADELENLVRGVDKAYAAQGQLADMQAILSREVEKGAVSQERANQIMEVTRRQLEGQLDPMGALNEELAKELDAIGLSAQEREVSNRVRQIENDLLGQGIILKDGDTEAIRRQIEAIQAATDAEEKRKEQLDFQKSVLDGIRGPQAQYEKTMEALNNLLAQGAINFDEYNRAANDALITLLDTQTDVGSGVERALLKLERDYTDFASMAENAITNFASSAEDAFVQFVKTGKLSFNDLADSIIADISRMAFRAAASGLFGSDGLLGSLIGSAAGLFGGFFGGGVGAPTQLGPSAMPNYSGVPGLYHGGGTAGAPGRHRTVDMSLFANAPRLHSGSMGLQAGEVAAILREDERVYTPEQDAARMGRNTTTVIVNNNAPNTKASANESTDGAGNKTIQVMIDEAAAAALNNPSSKTFKTMRERFGANVTTRNR